MPGTSVTLQLRERHPQTINRKRVPQICWKYLTSTYWWWLLGMAKLFNSKFWLMTQYILFDLIQNEKKHCLQRTTKMHQGCVYIWITCEFANVIIIARLRLTFSFFEVCCGFLLLFCLVQNHLSFHRWICFIVSMLHLSLLEHLMLKSILAYQIHKI